MIMIIIIIKIKYPYYGINECKPTDPSPNINQKS
jgi:hypothetical protein